jgi:hypothetical protein
LRNPNRAVAGSRPLQAVGARARSVFERLGANRAYRDAVIGAVDKLGDKTIKGFPKEVIEKLRDALRIEFSAANFKKDTVFDHELWKAMMEAAEDPDIDVPLWLKEGCPTGIGDSVITGRGIFPAVAGTSAAILASKECAKLQDDWHEDHHVNYKSFYVDSGDWAEAEIERIRGKGFIQTFDTWDEVVKKWPGAIASKVALILKERADGSTKTRLIVDMRRSGVNGGVVVTERIVLPRMSDYTASIIDLMEYNLEEDQTGDEENIELATVDFEDAFHTLELKEEDRGVMAFRTLTGWGVFNVLCCGMAGAPMVWCRTSAAGCRLGQACFSPRELRLQCFVDDPALAVRGSAKLRSWLLGCLLLFWVVLGFRFNWGKGTRGQEVPWIGAQVAIQRTN